MKKISILILIMISGILSLYSQLDCEALNDTIQIRLNTCINLRLQEPNFNLSLNTKEVIKNTRTIYICQNNRMYEQHIVSKEQSDMLRPYKAYFPTGTFYYTDVNTKRDSYNPYGVNSPGEALILGVINGYILGNKY